MKFDPKEKLEAWCLVIIRTVKLPKNVLDTHFMNLEAFTVEYSPKLQILFLDFEISHDWLNLDILF